MRIGSLFSGIGGLELGLEWAGVGRTVWQVEKDANRRATLAKHWPNVPRFTDVREVGANDLAPVDVICGGFPCIDTSYAGKREGMDGPDSGLWFEFARIIGELRPRFVIVENVPGLLTLGMGDVLGSLAALGYDAEWEVLSAEAVGAPQIRERVFIIAWREWEPVYDLDDFGRCECCEDWFCPRCELHAGDCPCLTEGLLAEYANLALEERPWGVVAYPVRERGRGGIAARQYAVHAHARREVVVAGGNGGRWTVEPPVCGVVDGVPGRLDRICALGNAVVPQVAQVVGHRLLQIAASLDEAEAA